MRLLVVVAMSLPLLLSCGGAQAQPASPVRAGAAVAAPVEAAPAVTAGEAATVQPAPDQPQALPTKPDPGPAAPSQRPAVTGVSGGCTSGGKPAIACAVP